MNQVEARRKGLPWTPFKDIPHGLRFVYDLILALNPIAEVVAKQNPCVKTEAERTAIYENCCEYWFNNQLLKATGHASENGRGKVENANGTNHPKDSK